MKHNKLFSLSLQKQIGQYEFSMENEINKALNELNIRSLLRQANIVKEKGYATVSLFFPIILIPFLKQSLSWSDSPKCFLAQINAQKDTYYRFLNHERSDWRKLVSLLALKVVSHNDDVPLRQKILIADDTIAIKTGKNMEGVRLNVVLPKSGYVRIAFISDGKKQWHPFLCTDIESDLHEIPSYYARRWAIETFFRDAKQMLCLGKEQSNTFDAVISCHSLVMIRYLLLAYISDKYRLTGPIRPLFRDVSNSQPVLHIAEQMWNRVKELLIKSGDIICHKIEPDLFFYIIDVIEEAILKQTQIATKLTAKR